MSPGRLVLIGALVLVVILFVVGVATGATGDGRGEVRQGPVGALESLLVRPASLEDVRPRAAGCVQGTRLVIPRAGACTYDLRGGFLARRLRLRLEAGTSVPATFAQPEPRVEGDKTLTAGSPVEFTFRQEGSTLSLACVSPLGVSCRVVVVGD